MAEIEISASVTLNDTAPVSAWGPETEGGYTVVCNTIELTKHFRESAKLTLVTPQAGGGYASNKWRGKSRGGRIIEIYITSKKLTNFRPKWVYGITPDLTKDQVQELSEVMQEIAEGLRDGSIKR